MRERRAPSGETQLIVAGTPPTDAIVVGLKGGAREYGRVLATRIRCVAPERVRAQGRGEEEKGGGRSARDERAARAEGDESTRDALRHEGRITALVPLVLLLLLLLLSVSLPPRRAGDSALAPLAHAD